MITYNGFRFDQLNRGKLDEVTVAAAHLADAPSLNVIRADNSTRS